MFINNRKHKKQISINGVKIIGEFNKNQQLHGQADLFYTNGAKFKGYYEQGTRIYGTLDFNNGYVYRGHFLGDKFQGEGQLTLPTGKLITGKWKQGNLQGNVLIKYVSGDLYYGEVKQFKKHGKGYLFLKNGDKYIGEFKQGSISGEGDYFQGDKCIGQGVWKDGVLIESVNNNKKWENQQTNGFIENLHKNKFSILPSEMQNIMIEQIENQKNIQQTIPQN